LAPIASLGDLGPRLHPFAPRLVERLRQFKSPAARIFLIHAITQSTNQKSIRDALVVGLVDNDPAIKTHCANLVGRNGLDDDEEIRGMLQRLHKNAGSSFAVKQSAALALSQPDWHDEKPAKGSRHHFGYVLVKGLAANLDHIQELEKEQQWKQHPRYAGVLEAALVQGRFDVLLKVAARNKHAFDDFVMYDIQGLPWVKSTFTMAIAAMPIQMHWVKRPTAEASHGYNVSSWVLISARSMVSGLIVLALRTLGEFSEACEAAAVFGPAEVVVNLRCDRQETLDDIIKTQIAKIPYVESTETLRVLEPIAKNQISCGEKRDLILGDLMVD
jgi:DNA-binding Lrp family transcriptional regulator